ncbi:MAG: glutamyl-tRNA reductase [Puniceicoccales bacterium]|nr:glutamyl-tRNA reductase [Puniceicoccales bacterium]
MEPPAPDNAPAPRLAVLTCTHETAPLSVREKLVLAPERADAFLARLRALDGVAESVLLSTCNRVEIYISPATGSTGSGGGGGTTGGALRDALLELIATHQRLDPHVVAAHCRWHAGPPALEHLFLVAAGLDSQMVGESEILGQTKDAYAEAFARGDTGPVLNRAFQKSFHAAAWVRTHTPIGQGQVSIGSVAVELATRVVGDLAPRRVLVLGTGEVGRKTARAFVSRGARSLTIASRTIENARALAGLAGAGATAAPLAEALRSLGEHDVVIGSSSAPSPLLPPDAVREAAARRAGAPLFLFDLGMPRNFPPDAGALPGVYLYNLDDLSRIANENLRLRLAGVEQARAALAERAGKLWERLAGSAPKSR